MNIIIPRLLQRGALRTEALGQAQRVCLIATFPRQPPCLPPAAVGPPERIILSLLLVSQMTNVMTLKPVRNLKGPLAVLAQIVDATVSNMVDSSQCKFSELQTWLYIDSCLNQLARAICASDDGHIHPATDELDDQHPDTDSLASDETCKCEGMYFPRKKEVIYLNLRTSCTRSS